MGLEYTVINEMNYFEFFTDLETNTKYYKILESDLSILGIWISLFGKDIMIKTRSNNIFYSDCPMHNAEDIPVCINENKKAFFCYGCGKGGTLVALISIFFKITREDAVNILYAYINDDLELLNKQQLDIIKKIFKNYTSSALNKYFEESKLKSALLNTRIKNYIQKYGDSNETRNKMVKRLCCSKIYISSILN